MATQIMTVNPQKVTVPGNTNDNDIDISAFMLNEGTILIDNISGPIRFNISGVTSATNSAVYTTTDKIVLFKRYAANLASNDSAQTLHFRGAAGGETFQLTVINQ